MGVVRSLARTIWGNRRGRDHVVVSKKAKPKYTPILDSIVQSSKLAISNYYPMKRLFIGNIPYSTQEDQLEALFQTWTVEKVEIVRDRETNNSKFAFVNVPDDTEALAIIEHFSQEANSMFNGRQIQINEAKPREDRPAGGGFRGGNGGGYRGGNDRGGFGGGRGGGFGGGNDRGNDRGGYQGRRSY